MPAPKMSMNVLLSLIIQSKITGKGVTGNGRLLVKLLQIIADNNGSEKTYERNILACFNDDPCKPSSYHKIDKLIGRFLPEGRYYPYSKLTFLEFENCFGNTAEFTVYIKKMQEFCDKTIADDKLERMVNTLVEIIRQDQDIDRILYGAEFIKKADLISTPAHPKKLCYPALLLGLLYYVHQHHTETPDLKLMDIPEKPSIRLTRYIDNDSLDLKIINDPIENVLFNSKRQVASVLKYPLELSCNGKAISEIPEEDVLITGLCGIGKTSLLNSIIGTTGSADLQLELQSFSSCIIERYSKVSCWILLNILLKYCYQGEYRSFESCCALEGEETVLLQLSELENDFKLTPINTPKYTLMLDGQNEILLCQQDSFAEEIDYIHKNWKNVRIIITCRNIPDNSIYHEFKTVRIIGIPCDELKKHTEVPYGTPLFDVLRIPASLELFNSSDSLTTRGELLDYYFSNIRCDEVTKYILQFALPLIGRDMAYEFEGVTISRSRAEKLIDTSMKIYLKNRNVYQDFVHTNNIDKNRLLESRRKDDWLDIIIRNTGLLEPLDSEGNELRFAHIAFRDYFAAKHIANAIEVFWTGKKLEADIEEYFRKIGLSGIWFDYVKDYPEKINIYAAWGELIGDHKCKIENEFYIKNNYVKEFLYICGQIESGYNTVNIMIEKLALHNGLICNLDFGGLYLPPVIPAGVRFSLDGEYPCAFYDCTVQISRIKENEDNVQIFKECDFSGAKFLDIECRDTIIKMGGICDEECEYMDETYAEIVRTWHDVPKLDEI